MGEGKRFNKGKARYDLVHPWAHEQMVNVLSEGAKKYEERNWEKGMKWSNIISSLKRHMNAVERGEDYDKETGLLHSAHIACNAHFLTAYYKIYPQGDDRPHRNISMPRIALDIDEVLCDWVGDWTEHRGIDIPSSWWFDRGIVDEFNKMKKEGKLDEFYLSLNPLIKPEDIPFEPHCYITSRPVSSKITEKWLSNNGFPARPVHTVSVGANKVDIAKREGVDIFVDDAFHNYRDLNKAGICCFLMDAPHNQRYDVGFKRIKKLNELI